MSRAASTLSNLANTHEGPVFMVNLLKFKKNGGIENYLKYSQAISPILQKIGARVVFAGENKGLVLGDSQDNWDWIVIAEYPSAKTFIAMASSSDYAKISPLREKALERSALIATSSLPLRSKL
eukprot:TRINITY_DN4929_c0_g1_i3.p1 TRINITY_DN4929_c0_g1~~TRINITY_DN4929_c0_g1_i3.p1  ORF type:complete len:137 (+),score=28.71 TRINITY_DN4929_c0_g1_i3:41-412(+)